MRSNSKWVYSVAITLTLIAVISSASGQQYASNLQCYDCQSKGCTQMKYCGENQYCLRATIKDKNGVFHHNKQCVPTILDCTKYKKDMADKGFVVSDCKTCNYNLCNNSGFLKPSMFGILCLIFISIYFH
uniref:Secreted protein n=1 Tax=Xenopsylla cheopis TaxID=163159 RepID=A0A6M2DXW3_XENCH